MEQIIGGIGALSRAILDDTKDEAEQIVIEARHNAEATLAHARSEAEHVREQILQRARSDAFHMEQQTLATARLDAQRMMLTQREEMIDTVFSRAEGMLADIHRSERYGLMLQRLLVDAVTKLGEPTECVVRVTQRDLPTLQELDLTALAERWNGRVHLMVGDPLAITGGVVVEATDGHKRYNNSFEARLSLERARLRAQVYQLLRGES